MVAKDGILAAMMHNKYIELENNKKCFGIMTSRTLIINHHFLTKIFNKNSSGHQLASIQYHHS